MRKTKHIMLLFLALGLLAACKSTKGSMPLQYEYLLVERQGGGQLDFRMYPGDSRSHLNVYVSSCDFQPVDKRFQLNIDADNVEAIDEYYKALNGQIPLQGTLDNLKGKRTGTWLYLRFVHGNRQIEVTNPELLQRFALFEQLVRKVLAEQ